MAFASAFADSAAGSVTIRRENGPFPEYALAMPWLCPGYALVLQWLFSSSSSKRTSQQGPSGQDVPRVPRTLWIQGFGAIPRMQLYATLRH